MTLTNNSKKYLACLVLESLLGVFWLWEAVLLAQLGKLHIHTHTHTHTQRERERERETETERQRQRQRQRDLIFLIF
jgi:hypothetical protein